MYNTCNPINQLGSCISCCISLETIVLALIWTIFRFPEYSAKNRHVLNRSLNLAVMTTVHPNKCGSCFLTKCWLGSCQNVFMPTKGHSSKSWHWRIVDILTSRLHLLVRSGEKVILVNYTVSAKKSQMDEFYWIYSVTSKKNKIKIRHYLEHIFPHLEESYQEWCPTFFRRKWLCKSWNRLTLSSWTHTCCVANASCMQSIFFWPLDLCTSIYKHVYRQIATKKGLFQNIQNKISECCFTISPLNSHA